MSNSKFRKANINGPPYIEQVKNLISVRVLYSVIKLTSGKGFEIKFLDQTLPKSERTLILIQAEHLK